MSTTTAATPIKSTAEQPQATDAGTTAASSTAELRLALIARIAECDDLLCLRTVKAVLDDTDAQGDAVQVDVGSEADVEEGLVGDDAIVGRRPDGTLVRARDAVKNWDAAVADVLAGNGMSGEEAKARLAQMRAQR